MQTAGIGVSSFAVNGVSLTYFRSFNYISWAGSYLIGQLFVVVPNNVYFLIDGEPVDGYVRGLPDNGIIGTGRTVGHRR